MKLLIIADHIQKGLEIWRAIKDCKSISAHVLLINQSRRSPVVFVLSQCKWLFGHKPASILSLLGLSIRHRLHLFPDVPNGPKQVAFLRSLRLDVGLHAAGMIYRRPFIDCFRLGILNAHIGLLPRYRGRSVMEWSLLEGEPTGATVFFIDEGIDTGPWIVLREKIDIYPSRTVAEAKARLFHQDGLLYKRAIEKLINDDRPIAVQKPEDGRRYYQMSNLFLSVVQDILCPDPHYSTPRHRA